MAQLSGVLPLLSRTHLLRIVYDATSRAEREIDILREYRARLTADVVTGKLDVREAVKRLSAETEEPLPPDDLLEDDINDEVPEEANA